MGGTGVDPFFVDVETENADNLTVVVQVRHTLCRSHSHIIPVTFPCNFHATVISQYRPHDSFPCYHSSTTWSPYTLIPHLSTPHPSTPQLLSPHPSPLHPSPLTPRLPTLTPHLFTHFITSHTTPHLLTCSPSPPYPHVLTLTSSPLTPHLLILTPHLPTDAFIRKWTFS